MKLSDQIAKISSDLEVALSRAATTLETYVCRRSLGTYTGDKLDDDTLIDAADAARAAASDLSTNEEINDVIGALLFVEQE